MVFCKKIAQIKFDSSVLNGMVWLPISIEFLVIACKLFQILVILCLLCPLLLCHIAVARDRGNSLFLDNRP